MKKFLAALLASLLAVAVFVGCGGTGAGSGIAPEEGNTGEQPGEQEGTGTETETEEIDWLTSLSYDTKTNLSADGYVKGKIGDFSQYVGTDAYRTVSTAEQLLQAIVDAKYHYTNVWDEDSGTYTQVPADDYTEENFEGTVHVIEITQDINMGYYVLSAAAKNSGVVSDYAPKLESWKPYLTMSDMVLENGISQIMVETTSDLLIYSKNGAKLTHCGFKLTSDTNVVFRNLQFDELWQWEDAPIADTDKIGDYDWFGWAYFKIAFCGYIWIDHCSFGKSYDGQIDYSNPVYDANAGTAFRAPYGADGGRGLHISWCSFNAGSDDEDGYLYRMMAAIEEEYQSGSANYLYYNALRDGGASFEDILYGIAIPQKKGFLCGDDATFSGSYDNADDYNFNLKLQVSFSNCYFKNLEDRIPKLRGGNAYLYNCIADSLQYYGYRTKLRSVSAASKVAQVNTTWKCGLVSQGIVCGNGGSVKAENCIFRGIESLLKNNDTKNVSPYVDGGYQLVNCLYQQTATSSEYIGSSTDTNNRFPSPVSSVGTLSTENFSWHTDDGEPPFTVVAVELFELEETLAHSVYGAGTVDWSEKRLLQSSYIA